MLGNLDQLFGLLSRRLSRSSSMVDAESVRQILEEEVTKPSMKKWINASVTVSIVRRYRNWKAHNVENCPVQLETLVMQPKILIFLGDVTFLDDGLWAQHFLEPRKKDCFWMPLQIIFSSLPEDEAGSKKTRTWR